MPTYTTHFVTPVVQPSVDVNAVRDQILALMHEELRVSTGMIVEKITELETRLQETEAKTRLLSDQVYSMEHAMQEKEEKENFDVADLNPGRPRATGRQRRKPPLRPLTVCEPERHYQQPTDCQLVVRPSS